MRRLLLVHQRTAVGLVLAAVLGATLTLQGAGSTSARAAATGHLVLVDDFDDDVTGSLREQGPWHVNTPGAADGAIASDPVLTDFSGKTLLDDLDGQGGPLLYRGNAYAALGAQRIAQGATGTVFFEIATGAPARTDLHLGLSTDESPGLGMDTTGDPLDLDDFGPEVSVTGSTLVARDGAQDRPLTGFAIQADVRFRVWLVVDNAARTFSVHAATAAGQPTALASATGQTSFSFRSAATGDLQTFLHLNDPDDVPTADSYLDSLHIATDGVDLTDPSPHLALVADFDDLALGPLDGRAGWSASSGAEVTAGPAAADGRVLTLRHGTRSASHPLPALGPEGTLFFRMRREGQANASLGLTDAPGRRGFDDFRVQGGATGSSAQVVRDGGSFATVGRWTDRTWRCVWMVADSTGEHFSVYGRGGDLRTTTRLRSSTADSFAFRTGAAGALDSFLAVTGSSTGAVQVDHLSVDTAQRDLRTPAGASCPFRGAGPVRDPAPAVAQPPRLELALTTVAQLPPAAADSPARRANAVVPVGTDAGRLAVPTLEGEVLVLRGGVTSSYLDVRPVFPSFADAPGLGAGLGYVTFAPDFDTSGLFYTVHTEAGDALPPPTLDAPPDTRVHGVVTEWRADDPALDSFVGTHREVLRLGFSHFTHGIQQISFDPGARPGDPDFGLLYLGVGDGDETPFFSSRPADLGAPQGKLLRIDPRASGSAPYTVPDDNPFVGVADALPEVYASGLRNPHRFSWDPRTGRMLVGNIGEKQVDSLYEVHAGDDFGWNRREGAYVFDTSDPTHVYPLPQNDTSGVTYPVLQVGRRAGKALVGGVTYAGRLAALRGHYVFGDIVDGTIREVSSGLLMKGQAQPAFHDVALVVDGRPTTLAALAGGRVDLRFGQDAAGELYVISKGLGQVWGVTGARSLVSALPRCATGRLTARPTGQRAWRPQTPRLWRFSGSTARLVEPGTRPPGYRRPYEYALVRGRRAASFDLRAEVRVDRPGPIAERDVIIMLGYGSGRSFSYVHLSDDSTSYAHNGIFTYDATSDRVRIDDQFDGVRSARPAIRDRSWHRVRVVHCAGSGATYVYVDDLRRPLMTATDTRVHPGLVGFGSFNDFGRIRDLHLRYSRP